VEWLYPEVEVRAVMGGLFEDFRPMREAWTRMSGGNWKDSVRAFFAGVATTHRMPTDAERMLDATDDFVSTYPACLAAKAAELQGPSPGKRYLRRLREAFNAEGRPIHHVDVQEAVAREAGIDAAAFSAALQDGRAERAFQADLRETRAEKVTGFPTFVVRRGPIGVRIEGYRPWDAFLGALQEFEPDLEDRHAPADEAAVLKFLQAQGRCATREVAEVFGVSDDEAEILLDDLEARGKVSRRPAGSGLLWATSPGS
jgi:predicted DsbA family dithiol-disulfide isomerase